MGIRNFIERNVTNVYLCRESKIRGKNPQFKQNGIFRFLSCWKFASLSLAISDFAEISIDLFLFTVRENLAI